MQEEPLRFTEESFAKQLRHIANWCDGEPYEPVPSLAEQVFSIGQGYGFVPAILLRCRTCQSTQLQVGMASHFTAVRCSQCGWQQCIHDG